jgi:hypothetical protein
MMALNPNFGISDSSTALRPKMIVTPSTAIQIDVNNHRKWRKTAVAMQSFMPPMLLALAMNAMRVAETVRQKTSTALL